VKAFEQSQPSMACCPKESPTLIDYITELTRRGLQVLGGTNGTYWVQYEMGAMVRVPTFSMVLPSPSEVNEVLRKGRAACVGYVLNPDERHPQNAWLYVAKDQSYSLNKLGKGTKSSIKRGLQNLRIGFIDSGELLNHGVQAFCDTRKRVGLSDGTSEAFRRRFTQRAGIPGHVFFGAWYQDQLVAFLSMIDVDDWLEIEGSFSMTDFLNYYPNDLLLYTTLTNYLVERGKNIVSYGLSSIQSTSNEAGLHAFKRKIGFDALPVYRSFILHPFLRPFNNELTLCGLKTGLRIFPKNRLFKKAAGVLALTLNREISSE